MTNPYHDGTGRFCSKGEMQTAINNAALSGDTKTYFNLRKDFEATDKPAISLNFVLNVLDPVGKHNENRLPFLKRFTVQAENNSALKAAKVAVKYFPQAVNNMNVLNQGGKPIGVKVSKEEQAALYHYVAGYDLNNDVYGGKDEDIKDDRLNHDLVLNHSRKLISQVFDRIPEGEGIVAKTFRGVRCEDWKGNNFQEEFLNKLKPGQKVSFPGYTSTSPDEKEASYFVDNGGAMLELEGTGGLALDALSAEVLYRRNTEWVVVSSQEEKNQTRVVLRMV